MIRNLFQSFYFGIVVTLLLACLPTSYFIAQTDTTILDNQGPVLVCKPFVIVSELKTFDALAGSIDCKDNVTPTNDLWSNAFVSNQNGSQLTPLNSIPLVHGVNSILVIVKDKSDNVSTCKMKVVQINNTDLPVKCKSVRSEMKNGKEMFSAFTPSGVKSREVAQTLYVSQGDKLELVTSPDKINGGKTDFLSLVIDANQKIAACIYQTTVIDINTIKE